MDDYEQDEHAAEELHADSEHHMLECDMDHEHTPELCCSCGGGH